MDESTQKTCSRCGETKVLADSHRDSRTTNGRRADCRSCVNARNFTKWEAERDAGRERKRLERERLSRGEAKRCRRCGQDKPLLEFYKLAKSPDGRQASCRECFLEHRRKRRAMSADEKSAERKALAARADKTCTACGETRLREDFRATKNSADGMVARCKPCEAEWHRRHYEENRETVLARQRERYWEDPVPKRFANREWDRANRERKNAASRAWYAANKDRAAAKQREWAKANPGARARLVREWRAANRERDSELTRQWRERNRDRLRQRAREIYAANPMKYVERAHQRRALIANVSAEPINYDSLWTGRCGICELPINLSLTYPHPMSRSVDHIIPLAIGGTHTQDNLQFAHLRCNVAKGARLLE